MGAADAEPALRTAVNQVACAPVRTVISLQRHPEGLGQSERVRRTQGWSAKISTTLTLLLVDGGMVR